MKVELIGEWNGITFEGLIRRNCITFECGSHKIKCITFDYCSRPLALASSSAVRSCLAKGANQQAWVNNPWLVSQTAMTIEKEMSAGFLGFSRILTMTGYWAKDLGLVRLPAAEFWDRVELFHTSLYHDLFHVSIISKILKISKSL